MLDKIKASLKRRYQSAPEAEEPDFGAPEPVYRDLSEDELDWWQQTSSIDALHLAPIEGPYLTPMHARVVRQEELLMGRPWAQAESLQQHIKKSIDGNMTPLEQANMGDQGYALLDDPNMPYASPRKNSVTIDDKVKLLATGHARPSRPKLPPRPHSERRLDEAPLLHQALRRQHQFDLSRRILKEVYRPAQPEAPSLLRHNYSLLAETDNDARAISRPVSPTSHAISLSEARDCATLSNAPAHQTQSPRAHPGRHQQEHGGFF